MAEILYKDKQVTVYKELMVINKYYFPLATSKTILFKDIERLGLMSSEGVEHRWGVSAKYLNNWFPLDIDRKLKHKFIEIVIKGKKTKPSITPEDPDKVFGILWQNLTPEGKAFVESQKLKDGDETVVAQEEMGRAEVAEAEEERKVEEPKAEEPKQAPEVESLE